MDANVKIDAKDMVEAFARLKTLVEGKNTPVSKVIRNAARDFAKAAYKATPLARVSKSEYYRAVDPADPRHKWYIHESMLKGRSDLTTKNGNMKSVSRINKDGRVQLHKVRIRKGYSKATWGGAFASLGLPSVKEASRWPVNYRSGAINREPSTGPEAVITDQLALDSFGRSSSDKKHDEIRRAGFARAAANMAGEYQRLLKEKWRG